MSLFPLNFLTKANRTSLLGTKSFFSSPNSEHLHNMNSKRSDSTGMYIAGTKQEMRRHSDFQTLIRSLNASMSEEDLNGLVFG